MKKNDIKSLTLDWYADKENKKKFNKLVERLIGGIRSNIYRKILDEDATNDCLLVTLEKAWNKRDMYSLERGQFSTWLWKISNTEVLNHFVEKKKMNRFVNTDFEDMDDYVHYKNDIVQTMEETSLDSSIYTSVVDKMMTIINEHVDTTFKNPLAAECIKARYFRAEEEPIKSIAERLNIPENTVKTYIHRGLAAIKVIVNKDSRLSSLGKQWLCDEKYNLEV